MQQGIKLTEEQSCILQHCNEDIYISAAPGSGKSTMLSLICGKLLQIPTNRVMLVTFTNKAAKSIKSKCSSSDQNRIIGGTFHSIAYRLMKQNGMNVTICDENKKRVIIKKLFGCRKEKDKFEGIYERISIAKSKFPMQITDEVRIYNEELRRYSLVDFDDIIYTFLDSSKDGQGTGSRLGIPSITHCLVDELQDTSGPQLEMLREIRRRTSCTMVGVADDDQSIYAWRGARPENVRDFISEFKCTTLNMGTNFRSKARIVERSRALIECNTDRLLKQIRPNTNEKGLVKAYKCANPFDEIDYIKELLERNEGTPTSILYRNRTFKNHLEFQLRKAGIRYRVNDFLDITDRSAVRVMIACLKIASGDFDVFDLEQASKALKGIGSVTLKKIQEEAVDGDVATLMTDWKRDEKLYKKVMSITKLQKCFREYPNAALDILVRYAEKLFIKSFDYQDDMKLFLLEVTRDFRINAADIKELANELGLSGQADGEDNDEDALVELSTVHGYKGLEQDIVILPFCQTYLESKPGRKIVIEEERRLFYVAATRAKNKLYMCYSGAKPRFIEEMGL